LPLAHNIDAQTLHAFGQGPQHAFANVFKAGVLGHGLAHFVAHVGHGFTEFLEGLHLIFTSRNRGIELFIDVNIKKSTTNQP
jgi:hypothetical protein